MLFRFLANCFLLFCSSFVVLKFPSLLANIQRPNWRLAQGPQPVSTQLFDPCPLYSFTQMHAQGFAVIVNFMMMWNFNFKGMLTPSCNPLLQAYVWNHCLWFSLSTVMYLTKKFMAVILTYFKVSMFFNLFFKYIYINVLMEISSSQ